MTTIRRRIANRAEVYAIALRRLSKDLEYAAQRPTDWRIRGILEADEGEAASAGDRLAEALQEAETLITDGKCHFPAPVHIQVAAIRERGAKPDAIRGWANRWDAYAIAIDP